MDIVCIWALGFGLRSSLCSGNFDGQRNIIVILRSKYVCDTRTAHHVGVLTLLSCFDCQSNVFTQHLCGKTRGQDKPRVSPHIRSDGDAVPVQERRQPRISLDPNRPHHPQPAIVVVFYYTMFQGGAATAVHRGDGCEKATNFGNWYALQ